MPPRRRPPPPPEPGTRTRTLTARDARERRNLVEQLYARGLSDAQVVQAFCAQFSCTAPTARKHVQRTRELWAREAESARPYERERFLRKLQQAQMDARTVIDPETRRPAYTEDREKWKWTAITQLLKLEAEVVGALAPIKIDSGRTVDLAALAIMSSMTPERRQQLLERAQETKRAALAAGYDPDAPALPPRKVVNAR